MQVVGATHNSTQDTLASGRSLVALCAGVASIEGVPDLAVTGVTDDSRRVVPGMVFVAKRGAQADGAAFIRDAVSRGALIVVAERSATVPHDIGVPTVRVDSAADALATLAERFHGEPSAALTTIGVTGTNGKTTTTHLIKQLLEAGGVRTGVVSTCAIEAGGRDSLAKATQTTPGAAELSERLAAMRDKGCAAAVVETSSHALEQKRVAAIRYTIAVFTNLTGDHLDYHGTMEQYASAKARLFATLPHEGWAIVNADDAWAPAMLRNCRARVIACAAARSGRGPAHLDAPVAHEASVETLGIDAGRMRARFDGPFGSFEARLPLVGEHNAMNALQSACAAWCAGATRDDIVRALEGAAAPPGRLEPVTRAPGVAEPFGVLVDYAHTDDALGRALAAARSLVAVGASLRVVFGCGGDRDRTKRPRMGRVAGDLADVVIVTSDNPRTEDPDAIVAQVVAGVDASRRDRARAIVDRRLAIHEAIRDAQRGDVVLIAGKGHEDYQILPDGKGGTVTRHFDDREVARDALIERFGDAREVEAKAPPGAVGSARGNEL
ncbi:MAG: UDP-N-acetylmuramoyl-L-alanyl-D-glutamate--2,6-diaminopimelate ligase [Phycisphaeraceae bacterium]|nr:UDP-N-acetylmuramoyl-L-alanyl-D-glutamate--2,6-diaminopimelate ligase [Phycisphaeraceae bacterium]